MKSLRARVVIIFLLLILLAMQLIGWYVERSLEAYYLGNHAKNVQRQARLMAAFVQRYLAEDAPIEYITNYIRDYGRESGLDLLLLDRDANVIAASADMDNLIGRRIILPEIDQALTQMTASQQIRETAEEHNPVLSLAVPVHGDADDAGALYLNASLSGVYQTLHDVRSIMIGATLLSLVVTGVIGFILAGTITAPVVQITERAAEMAAGNFDQRIEVNSDDEIGRLSSMFNHLTERLGNTVSQMSEEKRRLEVVMTNMADGVIAFDSDAQVMLINPRASEMLGVNGQELEGKPLQEIFSDLPLSGPAEETMDTGEDLTVRFELSQPHRVMRAHLAAIPSDDEELRGMVVVLHDITEQEQAEQRRKEFIADVSHELKTPLTTVKSYTETLLDGAVNDESVRSEFLQVVLDETDRMSRMVRDLLDLSLIDSGRIEWEQESFSVVDLIDDACGKLAPRAKDKDISLGYRGDEDVPDIYGDSDRIEQVLVNLLTNAVEYTPRGGQVRVNWRKSGEFVEVVVSDTGIGIPREELPWVFERFYRVDKARSRSSGGTGLGLAIAKDIVDSHGGSISVDSEEGEGTAIAFCLPIDSQKSSPGGESNGVDTG